MKSSVATLMLGFMTLFLGGCNLVSPIAYILAPEPKIEALYALEDRPTVVFIDDRENRVSPIALRRVIADRLSQELMMRKVVTKTISPRDAEVAARQRDRYDNMLSIDAIGRAVGAEQVIYIEMQNFQQRTDRYTLKPWAKCKVRVIDVTNRVRLFPSAESGEIAHPVQVQMGEMRPEQYNSRATRNQIAQALANEIGTTISRLFYEYSESKLGTNLR